MTNYDTLLLPMFHELRREGMPLGVSDYIFIIEALHQGMGLEDASSLKRLCLLLWAKSEEDQGMVERAFNLFVEPYVFSRQESASPPQEDGPPIFSDSPLANYESEPSSKEQRQQTIPVHTMALHRQPESYSQRPLTSLKKKYFVTPRYPLDYREVMRTCRQLRRLQRKGLPEELDVEGTIQRICQTGFFLGPVLRPRRHNQVHLVLLLDQHGSMAPFSPVTRILREGILQASPPNKICVYYFHDCPETLLYEQPELSSTCSLLEVLAEHVNNSAVLIVSDAGAARGHYDGRRVTETKIFLKALSSYTYLYCWVNPLPLSRWKATTAEDIASLVPMFPLTREGLTDAITVLQGNPSPLGG